MPHASTALAMNQAIALHQAGRLAEAQALYQQVLSVEPRNADAMHNLAVSWFQSGQLTQARDVVLRAIAIKPEAAAYHNTLGLTLDAMRALAAAAGAHRTAIQLDPRNALFRYNLGLVLLRQKDSAAAIDAFENAIKLSPAFPDAHNMLGAALMEAGKLDQAITSLHRAIAQNPAFADALNNLGNALKLQAHLTESIAAFEKALSISPQDAQIHSNLINTLLFDPACTPGRMLAEVRNWQRVHAAGIPQLAQRPNKPSSDGKIRIGYVSPDFREHCQRFFVLPLLRHHDRSKFHITCYSIAAIEDQDTLQHRKHADVWRDISAMTDQAAAELIREDRIDILVDLTLHMAGNRLLLFARKPAPIAVTWLGYPGTTGVDAIDYRLTDRLLDPPGENDVFYTEKTVHLAHAFWCYDPQINLPPGPLPADDLGAITFGCLNNFAKINPLTLDLWTRVLREVPHSRMIILADDGTHRSDVLNAFQRGRVDPARVHFEPRARTEGYFRLYQKLDIALDTFPCNGHTTTLDSIWMGVPVVSCAGRSAVSRGGLSILSTLGHPQLVAESAADYIRIGKELASDLPRLRELRQSLRHQLQQSPLMDAARFAGDIESIFSRLHAVRA